MRIETKQERKEISEIENKIDNIMSNEYWENDNDKLYLVDKYERQLMKITEKYKTKQLTN